MVISVGIDVSKDKHDCFIVSSEGEVLADYTRNRKRKRGKKGWHRSNGQKNEIGRVSRAVWNRGKCRSYLEKQRWPEGYACPKCGAHNCFRLSNGLLQCSVCRHQTSVTAGTIMHLTQVPLTKWVEALYFVSQEKRGISGVELQTHLGVTYKRRFGI